MKRIVLFIILCLFLVTGVTAKECDSNNIEIKSVEIQKIDGEAEEINSPTIKGNKISFDLQMIEVGDVVDYKILLKNNSNDTYYFNNDSIGNNSEYISYQLLNNNTKLIKPNEEKTIEFRISYKKKIPDEMLNNGSYKDINTYSLNITNKKSINNPLTGNYFIIVLIMVLISIIIISVLLYKNKKIDKVMMFLIGVTLCIPTIVSALCSYNIELKVKLQIESPESLKGFRFQGDLITFDFLKNLNYMNKNINGFIVNGNGLEYDVISENSADVTLHFIVEKEDSDYFLKPNVFTDFSIEEDAETGDKKIIVGECKGDSESIIVGDRGKKIPDDLFTYNGMKISYILYDSKTRTKFCNSLTDEELNFFGEGYEAILSKEQLKNMCLDLSDINRNVNFLRMKMSKLIEDDICPAFRNYLGDYDVEEMDNIIINASSSST